MKKKVISAILAGACALSALGFSATAAATEKAIKKTQTVTLKASVALAAPAINVSVPSGLVAVVNPYGVKVTVNDIQYGETGIASPIYTIKNYTTTSNIKVTAAGTVAAPTKTVDKAKVPVVDVVTSTSDDLYKTPKGKTVLAYVESKSGGTTLIATEGGTINENLFGTTKPAWAATKPTLANASIDSKTEGEAKQLFVLAKAEDGKFSYGQFKLAGDLKFAADQKWESEKLTINLVLKITPTGDKAA